MTTEKELMLALLSKTLNLDEAGVASLIYDEDGQTLKADALDVLLAKETERVAKLKGKEISKEKADQFYKKGQKEALDKLEAEFKEHYGFESDLQGLELVKSIVEKQMPSKGKEITEEDVKKSKPYQEAIRALSENHKAELKKVSDEFESFKTNATREANTREVRQWLNQELDTRQPIVSEKADKAARQKQVPIDVLVNQYEWEKVTDASGKVKYVPKKDGKIVEDPYGNPVEGKALAHEVFDMHLDFKVSESRSSASDPARKNGQHASSATKPSEQLNVFLNGRKPSNAETWTKLHAEIEESKTIPPAEKSKLTIELKNQYLSLKEVATNS